MAETRPAPSSARAIELPAAAMGQAHEVMAGRPCALAEVVEETRSAGAEVVWRGIVTPATIHAIASLAALAAQHGARLDLTPQGLDERETAFLEDFHAYGPGAAQVGDAGSGPAALLGAAVEVAFTAWQMRPRPARSRPKASGGKAVSKREGSALDRITNRPLSPCRRINRPKAWARRARTAWSS